MADLIVKTSKRNDRKEIYFRPSSQDPSKSVCRMTLQKLLKKPGCCEWLLHTVTASGYVFVGEWDPFGVWCAFIRFGTVCVGCKWI